MYVQYSIRKKRAMTERENKLINEVATLEHRIQNVEDNESLNDLDRASAELKDFRRIRMEGVLLRAKARWIEQGEAPTRYFCSLEKRQYTQKYISCLEVEGSLISEQEEIMQALGKHFSDIYKSKPRMKKLQDIKHLLGENTKSLSNVERDGIEGKVMLSEASEAVKGLHNDKSPGPDGFTANFYKAFWPEIGYLLVRSFNFAFETGSLSVSQKQGLITLIPKPGKSKEKIDNWRPISLLNTSQKILSAIMARRLKKVMGSLINANQKGFMKNRYIGECIRSIYDILWDTRNSTNSKKVLILFADYRRASASLNHDFIMDTLQLFNFGPDMQKWIVTLLGDASSCISQNQRSTRFFQIERGCRQGDCCSPLLFILCVEILGIMVRNNKLIKGYSLHGFELKLEQYADDSTFILDGSHESFRACVKTIDEFSAVSGLLLNPQKSQLLFSGSGEPPSFITESGFEYIQGTFRYLGIVFTEDLTEMPAVNFKSKVEVISNMLKGWLRRRLTLYGKRTVLKSLALSKLTYVLTVLPSPPLAMIISLQKQFFRFVWDNKQDKIRRQHLIRQYGMPCVETYGKAMKLAWVRRLMTAEGTWGLQVEFDSLFCCGDRYMSRFGSGMNPFRRDVFSIYDQFKQDIAIEDDDIWQTPIFLSSRFMIGRKPFWHRNLFAAGCRSIHDLYNDKGELMSLEEFRSEYPRILNALTFVALRHLVQEISIPSRIGNAKLMGPFIDPALLQILNSSCRSYDDAFVKVRYKKSVVLLPSQNKWNTIFNKNLPWDGIYHRYAKCSRNTTLIWFQDRILHRILTTNTFASKFMEVSELCTFCHRERETIHHLMVTCVDVRALWTLVKDMIRERLSVNLVLNGQEIILGIEPDVYDCPRKTVKALQRLLLIVKWYIYRCKVRKERPTYTQMLSHLKILTEAEFWYACAQPDGRNIDREINMMLGCGQ